MIYKTPFRLGIGVEPPPYRSVANHATSSAMELPPRSLWGAIPGSTMTV
jgi:hypothetical protein